jgi:hypothetical protein
MTYRVVIQPRVLADLKQADRWAAEHALADDEVHVLHIRRASMSPARREDLQD